VDCALRDPTDQSTVLHKALIDERWNVAKHLIRSTTDDEQPLLLENYNVTGQSKTLLSAASFITG